MTVWGSGLANEYTPESRSNRDYGNTDINGSSGKIPTKDGAFSAMTKEGSWTGYTHMRLASEG